MIAAPESISLKGRADWLDDPALQVLLAALSAGGEEARVAGGAVRNTLLGEPVGDIDIATTTLPDETISRAKAAGFKTVPTGIDHGTITVVADGVAHEVTTLRADVETHGRHATVVFGRDWITDAERRDFTINALYATASGDVIDLVGGLADLESRTLRFIGTAEDRIREDYLRILRFFRFFAFYGRGRPDAEGLKACARLKDGLAKLSAERVWKELRRTLEAPDPSRALLWMRQTGVLTAILPESEKWGIDGIHGLVAAEAALDWAPDALLRLEAIVPPQSERMETLGERLKLANAERQRLRDWAFAPAADASMSEARLAKALYRGPRDGISDRLSLALAARRAAAAEGDKTAMGEAASLLKLKRFESDWEKPVFPVAGADLVAAGMAPGPELGRALRLLEESWIESGFTLTRDALLARAKQPG